MKNWGLFWLLGIIWGSSFLLIKVAVDQLGPLPLVTVRIGLAALIMAVFLRATGRTWPRARREVIALLFVGVFNTAVPFTLITWGEKSIDSGLATVLNATTPLFTLVFAHLALYDERMTPYKVLGMLLGFGGVALLASRQVDFSSPNPISGQAAVLVASACYGLSGITIRRYLRGVDPFTIAGNSLAVGGITMVIITLLAVHPLPDAGSLHLKTVLAVLMLATLNTVVAYFLFYHLISTWGATRTSMVTYVMPPIGVTLGAIFRDETVDWMIVAGTALIMAGIVAANWAVLRRRTMAPAAGE